MAQEIFNRLNNLSIFVQLNNTCEQVSDALGGTSVDQIRLILALLIVIPFGFFFQFLKGAYLRHLVGILVGIFLQYLVYQEGITNVLIETTWVYIMTNVFKKNAGKVVMIQSLFYLSLHHIYRQYTDYGGWKMDVSTVLMMSVAKYCTFAYNVQDMYINNSKVEEKSKKQKTDPDATMESKKEVITKIPSFFEYFSYIHFFGSAVMGPSFEFSDFNNFIHLQGDYKNIPFFKSLKNSVVLVFRTVLFIIISVKVVPYFPIERNGSPDFGDYSIGEAQKFVNFAGISASPFVISILASIVRWYYLNLSITFLRFRYYTGWTLADAGISSTGLSYQVVNTKQGGTEERFDKIIGSIPEDVELTISNAPKIKNWNISIQSWLRNYVYFRVFTKQELDDDKDPVKRKQKGKRSFLDGKRESVAQYTTLMVSAFWHGFYPSYYMAFFHWSMLISLNKYFTRWSKNYPKHFPSFKNPVLNNIYNFILFLIANTGWNYCGVMFQLLSMEAIINFLKATSAFELIVAYVLMVFFFITNMGQVVKKKETQAQDKKQQ